MSPPPLVIVTGPPASGQTGLAARLARDLGLPRISRDAYKEVLFDTLGGGDRDWDKRLGAASYAIVWQALEDHLALGLPVLAESNFRGEQPTRALAAIRALHPFSPIQVSCVIDNATLVRRHQERSEAGERHPGHSDDLNDEELQAELERGRLDPLPIGGEVIEVDTTDFDRLDYGGLVVRLRALLRPGS